MRALVWIMLADEDVVVEHSFILSPVRKRHYTMPVLNSSTPFSFVGAPISPHHHALTVTLILFEITFVLIA